MLLFFCLCSVMILPLIFTCSQAIHQRLGTIVNGRIDDYDRDVIFTEAYVNRHKAKIRGAFSAVTK